jgi:transcriptional regulator of acetoin/glycerol metabolism
VTDRLAREGLRELGRPVGIDYAAYTLLAQYAFPGEDAELSSIVQRLVSGCSGDVIRASDVQALGLPPTATRADYRKDPLTA